MSRVRDGVVQLAGGNAQHTRLASNPPCTVVVLGNAVYGPLRKSIRLRNRVEASMLEFAQTAITACPEVTRVVFEECEHQAWRHTVIRSEYAEPSLIVEHRTIVFPYPETALAIRIQGALPPIGPFELISNSRQPTPRKPKQTSILIEQPKAAGSIAGQGLQHALTAGGQEN